MLHEVMLRQNLGWHSEEVGCYLTSAKVSKLEGLVESPKVLPTRKLQWLPIWVYCH